MRTYFMIINTPSQSLLNWILISIIICKFNRLNALKSLHHLILYSPSIESTPQINFDETAKLPDSSLVNDANGLSIKPVFISQSADPLYLSNRKNFITFDEPTLDSTIYSSFQMPDQLTNESSEPKNNLAVIHLSESDNHVTEMVKMLNSQSNADLKQQIDPDNKSGMIRVKQSDTTFYPDSATNQTERKTFVTKLIESVNRKLRQKLIQNSSDKFIKSLAINRNVKISNFTASTDLQKELSKSRNSISALKRIGIKLGKLMKVKSHITFPSEDTIQTTNFDEETDTFPDQLDRDYSSDDERTESKSYNFVNQYFDKYPDLESDQFHKTQQTSYSSDYLNSDKSFHNVINAEDLNKILNANKLDDEMSRLAQFVERNLRIIGLETVQQLFSHSKNTSAGLSGYRNLIKEINGKLLDSGLKLRPENPDNFNSEETKSSNINLEEQRSDELSDDLNSIRRVDDDDDDDDLNDINLLHEFEEYMRNKMRLIRKLKKELDHDLGISENRKEQLIKSRKRRSRRMNKKRKANRLPHRKSKIRDPFEYRDYYRPIRTRRIKNTKKMYRTERCNQYSKDDKCTEESEIHEHYVPFSQDDQQRSETYDSQSSEQQHFSQYEQQNDGQSYDDQLSNHHQFEQDPQSGYEQQSYESPSRDHQSTNDYNNEYNRQQDYQPDDVSNNYKQDDQNDNHYNQQRTHSYDDYRTADDGGDNYNQMFMHDTDSLNEYHGEYATYHQPDYEHAFNEYSLDSLKKHHPHEHTNFDSHHTKLSDDPHHRLKEDLHLTKKLITNLLIDNKHKIFALLKFTKIAHLVVGKKFAAILAQLFLGKGLLVKKNFLLAAYKRCYIKIRTIDMLLIPVGVGTLLTPLFLPLAPLALIIFGIVKLFTCFLCFLLAV